MEMKDILGLGKVLPINKLIDLVSSSVGRISKSYFDKKDVDAKAYEIETLAKARAKEMKIIAVAVNENHNLTGGIEYKEEKLSINSPVPTLPEIPQQAILNSISLEERTKQRLDFQEVKKQINIENVTAFAAEELKNESPITDEPVDEDWSVRFFNIIKDISNEEMQALWGKILAGEIKQPKTYSLRTLELIRNLSKKEADTFTKVAKFAIKASNSNYLFRTEEENLLNKYNIQYGDIALLIEVGLIQPGEFTIFQLLTQNIDSQRLFIAGNTIMSAKVKANTPTIQMPVNVFTTAGNELIRLIKPDPPHDYLTKVANSIKSKDVEVKYGNIISTEGTKFNHTPLRDFDA